MPPLPFKRRAIEIFDPFHSFIGQFIGDFFSLLLMYRIFGKRVNMRFIAACVGFSLLVLLGLLYLYWSNGSGFFSDKPSMEIKRVVRIEKDKARIDIHDIIVFDSDPKTFAIAGRSDSLGRRQLLTSMDSILRGSDNIQWAKKKYELFEWFEVDNPVFEHRESFVPYYDLDTLFVPGKIHAIYRIGPACIPSICYL